MISPSPFISGDAPKIEQKEEDIAVGMGHFGGISHIKDAKLLAASNAAQEKYTINKDLSNLLYDDDDYNVDSGLEKLWERANMIENEVFQVLNVYVYNKEDEYHVITRYQSLGIFDLLACSHGYMGIVRRCAEITV